VINELCVKRLLVVGVSGSGKTTLGREAAKRLRVPFIELDALAQGPGWVQRPTFESDVDEATRADAWVTDGNYTAVRELLWSRADAIAWLDLPRLVIEWQVVRRSIVRWVTREELWNGNREGGPISWLSAEHPIRWAWSKHPKYRRSYVERFADERWRHLERLRLRSRNDVRSFLARL